MTEHNFKLAKRAMTLTFWLILVIVLVGKILSYNPAHIEARINILGSNAEFSCDFASVQNSSGE